MKNRPVLKKIPESAPITAAIHNIGPILLITDNDSAREPGHWLRGSLGAGVVAGSKCVHVPSLRRIAGMGNRLFT